MGIGMYIEVVRCGVVWCRGSKNDGVFHSISWRGRGRVSALDWIDELLKMAGNITVD